MPKKPDLDVVAVKKLAVTADVQGEAVLTVEIVGGQTLNLFFSSATFSKLEALMTRANFERAKVAPKQ
jgi:hypothetical protein